MPLDSQIVGQTLPAQTHEIDERWLMAYAASIGDYNPRYLDTEAHRVVGHPVFPVCLEWPVILDIRTLAGSQSLTPEEAARGVHAAHDLHLYRPICAGDRLATDATIISVRRIKPGAAYTMRLDTRVEATGELVAQTYQLGIYRGVEVIGGDRASEEAPELPTWRMPHDSEPRSIAVGTGAAHTYTECARIWNPIHTDRQVALAAGLPDIILHGTATLAMAITEVVNAHANGDPKFVKRLGGRFAAMVLMPSLILVQSEREENLVRYQVINGDGETAIANGFVEFA